MGEPGLLAFLRYFGMGIYTRNITYIVVLCVVNNDC